MDFASELRVPLPKQFVDAVALCPDNLGYVLSIGGLVEEDIQSEV